MKQDNFIQEFESNLKEETLQRRPSYGKAKEAGWEFGVHPNTIRNWCKAGKIKKHIVGGVSLYSFDEIDNFIQSKAM